MSRCPATSPGNFNLALSNDFTKILLAELLNTYFGDHVNKCEMIGNPLVFYNIILKEIDYLGYGLTELGDHDAKRHLLPFRMGYPDHRNL